MNLRSLTAIFSLILIFLLISIRDTSGYENINVYQRIQTESSPECVNLILPSREINLNQSAEIKCEIDENSNIKRVVAYYRENGKDIWNTVNAYLLSGTAIDAGKEQTANYFDAKIPILKSGVNIDYAVAIIDDQQNVTLIGDYTRGLSLLPELTFISSYSQSRKVTPDVSIKEINISDKEDTIVLSLSLASDIPTKIRALESSQNGVDKEFMPIAGVFINNDQNLFDYKDMYFQHGFMAFYAPKIKKFMTSKTDKNAFLNLTDFNIINFSGINENDKSKAFLKKDQFNSDISGDKLIFNIKKTALNIGDSGTIKAFFFSGYNYLPDIYFPIFLDGTGFITFKFSKDFSFITK